jgi:large subunit ribosomal protein L17
MRHLKAGRHLGRNASHRLALMRNLALALFRHERIITTVEKAKEVRPFIEKLITLAKRGTLHAQRLVMARLGPPRKAEVKPAEDDNDKDADHRPIVQKLFKEIGPRFRDRDGGYTRIIKRHERRLGDGGRTAFLELLKQGETKVRAKARSTPTAPRVSEPEESSPPSEPAPAPEPAVASETAPPAESSAPPQPEAEKPPTAG